MPSFRSGAAAQGLQVIISIDHWVLKSNYYVEGGVMGNYKMAGFLICTHNLPVKFYNHCTVMVIVFCYDVMY